MFQLKQYHGWSINELEELMPWEREVYFLQLQKWLQEEAKKSTK